jgi:surfactin synthase thioesterase subunit
MVGAWPGCCAPRAAACVSPATTPDRPTPTRPAPPAHNRAAAPRAPHLSGPTNDVDPTVLHALEGDAFWAAFERRYGHTPALAAPGVKQCLEPLFRMDFRAVETYQVGRAGR